MNQANQQDFLSISDFLVVLYRNKGVFIAVWLIIMLGAVAHALMSKKVYKATGIISVGKFNEELLEDGEFVAQKLKDYSFVSKAVKKAGIELDIPVSRLLKAIDTELVNEIKKTKDVGLVKLTVYYKGREKVVEIYKALTGLLIEEHQQLLDSSRQVLTDYEKHLSDGERLLTESISDDETMLQQQNLNPGQGTVPSQLLLQHTVGEKRWYRSSLAKDLNDLRIEAQAATKSYNTRLAAEPELPDSHDQPKLMLELVLGFITGVILATVAAFLWNLIFQDVVPKLKQA